MALIELEEVSKLFGFGDATNLALDEVSLSVNKGEFVAFMGPSGSGKSTLMNVIGLLDRPTHGDYSLNNRPVSRLNPNQQAKLRRDRIGFVFQYYNLLPHLTVLDNVSLPLAYKGMTPVRRAKRASDILELVGMRDREYYLPPQLSGGQAQRAAIARALINQPNIIIADEPTGNLDSHDSKVVMELLAEIHRQGNTILLVTHNPELTRYANRARRTYLRRARTTDEDTVAGVSAILKDIPGKAVTSKTKRRKVRRRKPTLGRRRKSQ
jgi:putative ABC transport system ATP-binding protein